MKNPWVKFFVYFVAAWLLLVSIYYVYQWFFMVNHTGPCGLKNGPCEAPVVQVSADSLTIEQWVEAPHGRFAIGHMRDSFPPFLLRFDQKNALVWAVMLKTDSKCVKINKVGKMEYAGEKGMKSLFFRDEVNGIGVTIYLRDDDRFDYICSNPL
jgi:hypothetical protein